MDYRALHSWDVSPKEAIKIQEELSRKVIRKGSPKRIELVAGVDVSFPEPDIAQAAVVVLIMPRAGEGSRAKREVLTYPELEVIEKVVVEVPVKFPYIPGLLAFREGPAVLAAVRKLKNDPDLFFFDAQGIAHPRRLGLASHLGLFLNKPTIGVAKSRLVGEVEGENLIDKEELVGKVVKIKGSKKPVFVSVGHLISLDEAVRLAVPEPTLLAHQLANV